MRIEIKNGIIIDGSVYKWTKSDMPKGDDCIECALKFNCDRSKDSICVPLFEELTGWHFEKVPNDK